MNCGTFSVQIKHFNLSKCNQKKAQRTQGTKGRKKASCPCTHLRCIVFISHLNLKQKRRVSKPHSEKLTRLFLRAVFSAPHVLSVCGAAPCLMQIRERSKCTIENAVHMSDGNAIVGHRHIPLGAVPQTILHFPLVQHAPPQCTTSAYLLTSSGNSLPEVNENCTSLLVNLRIQFGSFPCRYRRTGGDACSLRR